MLQILINFVFKILSVVATIVFYPIQALLNTFIPSLGDTLSSIITFIGHLVSVAPVALSFLGVPEGATSVFFAYIVSKYSFYLGFVVYKFILKAYQKLKP